MCYTETKFRFIRTYLEKSKPAFADLFKLSHTAIGKWESSEDSLAPISPSQEMVLRLYLIDFNEGKKKFYVFYKEIEKSIYTKEEGPLRITL